MVCEIWELYEVRILSFLDDRVTFHTFKLRKEWLLKFEFIKATYNLLQWVHLFLNVVMQALSQIEKQCFIHTDMNYYKHKSGKRYTST